MEEKNIRQILKRYLLGNADEKDISAVDNWYRSFDSEELVALPEAEAAATKQEIWDKVNPGISIEKKTWVLPSYMKVAAMVMVIAGAATAFLLFRNKTGGNHALAYTTISTGIGEKKKITIEDGSQLTLDAGTTIRVQNDFSRDRKIELVDGEVFFDVKKDLERPFVIRSEGLTTTVLGTSFNISAYKGLKNVSIGVVTGRVSVVSQSVALSVLEKEQALVYNKDSKTYKKMPLDESLTAWQHGRLVLNDLSFNEMAVIMKKNFGMDVLTDDDGIKDTRYTTELVSSMTPAAAAEVLAAIHHLKMKEEGKRFFLYR